MHQNAYLIDIFSVLFDIYSETYFIYSCKEVISIIKKNLLLFKRFYNKMCIMSYIKCFLSCCSTSNPIIKSNNHNSMKHLLIKIV